MCEYRTKRSIRIQWPPERNQLKRTVFVGLLLFVVACGTVFAEDYTNLLRTVDALATFENSDFSAEYTIVEDKPGEGRSATKAAIFRRDREQKYLILVLEPEIERGQGYLKLEETLWFYDPESRRFNFTHARERFQNTNARNSDFTRSTLAEDYNVISEQGVKLGRFDCRLLDLKANNDQVTFPIMRIWISDDNLLRKTEDYSLSGQLLRTTAIPSYQKVQGRSIPRAILIVDNLKGASVKGAFVNEKTQITITRPSLRALPNNLFTKAFLESMGR